MILLSLLGVLNLETALICFTGSFVSQNLHPYSDLTGTESLTIGLASLSREGPEKGNEYNKIPVSSPLLSLTAYFKTISHRVLPFTFYS